MEFGSMSTKGNIIIACAGQKGGNGKSFCARMMASEMACQKRTVAMVDLDIGQHTAADWNAAREANKVQPSIKVDIVDPDEEPDFRLKELAADFNLVVLDAPGFSDQITMAMALVADLVVLPTGPTVDDLRPTMRLFYELEQGGIDKRRMAVVLNRIGTEAEEKAARAYLKGGNIEALPTALYDLPVYRQALNVGKGPSEFGKEETRKAAQTLVGEVMKRARDAHKAPTAGDKSSPRPRRFVVKEGETW